MQDSVITQLVTAVKTSKTTPFLLFFFLFFFFNLELKVNKKNLEKKKKNTKQKKSFLADLKNKELKNIQIPNRVNLADQHSPL